MAHEIIPQPLRAEPLPGRFVLNPDTVMAPDARSGDTAHYLAEVLFPAAGFRLRIRAAAPPSNGIELRMADGDDPAAVTGFHRVDDGHETAACAPLSTTGAPAGSLVYRFLITEFKPGSLYAARLYLKGNGQTACRGQVVLKKIAG